MRARRFVRRGRLLGRWRLIRRGLIQLVHREPKRQLHDAATTGPSGTPTFTTYSINESYPTTSTVRSTLGPGGTPTLTPYTTDASYLTTITFRETTGPSGTPTLTTYTTDESYPTTFTLIPTLISTETLVSTAGSSG